MKKFIIVISLVLMALLLRFYFLGKESQKMTVDTGLRDGVLKTCESEDHCFHSDQVKDEIDWITSEHINEEILDEIVKEGEAMGWKLVKKEGPYLHFTAKSKIFGFVDDIEFHYHEEMGELHFRSESRVGKSDLGANEARIRKILEKVSQ